jgi:hypothetical protein
LVKEFDSRNAESFATYEFRTACSSMAFLKLCIFFFLWFALIDHPIAFVVYTVTSFTYFMMVTGKDHDYLALERRPRDDVEKTSYQVTKEEKMELSLVYIYTESRYVTCGVNDIAINQIRDR